MEIGGLRGLTFDTGQDKLIQDLQYQDQMLARKRAQDAALAQQLVGDIEFLKGSNQYDSEILKGEANNLINRLGEMTNQRGKGWNTDPNFLAAINYEKSQLGNSKAAIRSMAYQNAANEYQKYMDAASKDPKMYDMEKLAEFKAVLDNYGKDVDGNYLPSDKVEPIRFEPPPKFIDKDSFLAERAKSLRMDGHRKVSGGYEEFVPDETLLAEAKQIASSRPRQWEVEYTQNGIDPVTGIFNALKANSGYRFQRDPQDDFASWKRKADYSAGLEAIKKKLSAGEKGIDPYKTSVLDMEDFNPPDEELIAATFGSKPQYTINKGPNGTSISGQGDRFYYTRVYDRKPEKGDPPFKKGAIKEAEGYIIKPLEWGEENKIVYDPWGTKRYAIDPEFKDDYELFYPEGSEKPVVKIKARTYPIKADDPSLSRKYNALIKSTANQRNEAGNEQSMIDGGFRVGTDEAGNKWRVYPDGRTELIN